MPVALIVFGVKPHTDLHGALVLTPIIFTLPFFNRMSWNNLNFWRPLAYLSNLGFRKNKADKTPTKDKIQNEHECLSVAFKSIRRIHRERGFRALVLGREVNIKIWINFSLETLKGTINGLDTIQDNVKFINHIVIASVTLIICQIQIQPVSI